MDFARWILGESGQHKKLIDNPGIVAYIIGMKMISKALTLIVFTGIIGIQFATVIDDPAHLATPDPDCPICLAASAQVCIPPHVSIGPTPDVIFYLVEKALFDQERDAFFSIHSIRAPPLS